MRIRTAFFLLFLHRPAPRLLRISACRQIRRRASCSRRSGSSRRSQAFRGRADPAGDATRSAVEALRQADPGFLAGCEEHSCCAAREYVIVAGYESVGRSLRARWSWQTASVRTHRCPPRSISRIIHNETRRDSVRTASGRRSPMRAPSMTIAYTPEEFSVVLRQSGVDESISTRWPTNGITRLYLWSGHPFTSC